MTRAARNVTGAMQNISAVVDENTASTQEMTIQASRVGLAMRGIAQVAREQSAATDAVSESAESVHSQVDDIGDRARDLASAAEKLREMVARFRLTAEPTAIRPATRRAAQASETDSSRRLGSVDSPTSQG
ncbi:MAG: hypothetical protein LC797_24525 [Chloroflexi bacterium]|nr:hypothetical protein [Chloroflexota bacterium]